MGVHGEQLSALMIHVLVRLTDVITMMNVRMIWMNICVINTLLELFNTISPTIMMWYCVIVYPGTTAVRQEIVYQ